MKKIRFGIISAILLFYFTNFTLLYGQTDLAKRQKFLEEILKINNPKTNRKGYNSAITVRDSSWVDWQHRTGELPPDFDQMKSRFSWLRATVAVTPETVTQTW